MNIKAVREGIAENLKAHLDNIQISPYILGNPTPPAVHVMPERAEQTVSMQRGHVQRDFLVQVMVGLANDIGAQIKLDEWMSEESGGANKIVEAILSDPTLGGVVDDVQVIDDSGYQIFSRDGQPPVLGCEWRVRVYG